MELNLAGVETILTTPTLLSGNSTDELNLDLSGVDKILSTTKTLSKNRGEIVFQPEEADWSIARLGSIQDFYKKAFNRDLPISSMGQGAIHNKWNLDHRESVDVKIKPGTKEGKQLETYLRENNIPFLAFSKAIPGVATSAHYHIGRPSKKINETFTIGTTGTGTDQELDLTGINDILQTQALEQVPQQELDLTGVNPIQTPVEAVEDLSLAKDPNQIDFKVGTKEVPTLLELATRDNKPIISGKNPFQAGDLIESTFTYEGKPSTNVGIDNLLMKWNPDYIDLNDRFRDETKGLNLINVQNQEGFIEDLGNNTYKVKARPTRGAMALIEAYKEGGLPAYNATLALINQQKNDLLTQNKEVAKNLKAIEVAHPYMAAIASGVQHEVVASTQLATNLKYLPQAIFTGTSKGYDSQEYLDLINKEREEQQTLGQISGTIYDPPSFGGKIIAGAIGGIVALPRFALAGRLGSFGLPLMTYVENLHRGNREAALQALPMAIMVGGMHGAQEFLEAGGGTSAPFRRITKQDLSLFQDTIKEGPSRSIKNLTPFERQLVLRGSNALLLTGSSIAANPHQGLKDIASTLVIGLTYPVGRAGREKIFPSYVAAPIEEAPKIPFQLGERRIEIPLTSPPKYGKLPIIEQQREIPPVIYPSAESPNVIKYKEPFDPTQYVAGTEKGFQARGQGATLFLGLDDANLHLLELKRALEENTYKAKGDDLKAVLSKQQAIKNAIATLEAAIPEQTKQFFQENEQVIRESLKTNYEAQVGKEALKLKRNLESLKPSEVKVTEPETPVVRTGKESVAKLFAGKAGDLNNGTGQEKAHDILHNFNKIAHQGSLRSQVIPYGDVIARKISDLAYLSAFYIEDFYHRGVVPSVDIVLNKLRTSLGDFGNKISDEQAKEIYKKGLDFYNSNVADPFFSKMKQDAAERLPNKVNADQVKNILTLHKDEFEWTAGLDDFLKANDGKKINKNELLNIINQGQVRVEESIAGELNIDNFNQQLINIRKATGIGPTDPDTFNFYTAFNRGETRILDVIDQERPKYSLSAYQYEKLELPGAKNSKEVKLISPISSNRKYEVFDPVTGKVVFRTGDRNEAIAISFAGENLGDQQKFLDWNDASTKYKSPHWDEPNVVAHYRSNDRTTTDGKNISFSEEFQSDWAHDIRERGVKLSKEELSRHAELEAKYNGGFGKSTLTPEEFNEYAKLNDRRVGSQVEPNPFMGHNWKELIMKRFIRDATVAKDENGNYKYDGVGWTTARQQKERYGKILEGKDFLWKKNLDNTYTFSIARTGELGVYPHELDHITLERFAELTTKEAAQEVRDQEKDYAPKEFRLESPSGKFSLKEAVELRSGVGKYSDYDVALVNIAKKIGKRFGSQYEQKEIKVPMSDELQEEGALPYDEEIIHFLEITPSMRQSLGKEGLPLYGLGGSEPLKSPEIGVRNRITTKQGFDQHRDLLVKSLQESASEPIPKWQYENVPENVVRDGMERILAGDLNDQKIMQQEISRRKDNIFNSGLNPDAFIDQAKLLFKGLNDFAEFSKEMTQRFGDTVKPFLQDLWIQVKDLGKKLHQDERGFLNIQLRRLKNQASKDYRESKKKTFYFDNYSLWRGVGLAQSDPRAGEVIDTIRYGQRIRAAFENNVLENLRTANKLIKKNLDQAVADNIWIGNENGRTYTDKELAAGDATINRPALNTDQIEAYKNIRQAVNINLDIRRETKLYSLRERATRLNNQLSSATHGTPEWTSIANKLLDINKSMQDIYAHFNTLKQEGYISTQRRGKIAAYIEDPQGKLYQHFNSLTEADRWLTDQIANGANAATAEIHDVRTPANLRQASAKLTPGQFEDLIDAAGVNPKDPEIEKIRDEVYSRFPSFGYELKRDFVRGYDRNWEFMIDSITHQTETYANSFYSRVAGEEGLKALDNLNIQKTNLDLHDTLQKYIDHEISSAEQTGLSKAFAMTRKGVYIFQLSADVHQFWLNAIAQPITQTYSYFARVQHNGIGLKGIEPEKYFAAGWNLAKKIGIDNLTGSNSAPKEFKDIYNRLSTEGVVTPEFNKSLLQLESEKTVQARLKPSSLADRFEHWGGVFMRAGETTTRTHAAAEAYLVGKNKFKLSGEELTNFIVRAVDATQSNPSRAEMPLLIRGSQNTGEIRKLFYQFNAFNHMWVENLALNVRADFQARSIKATARHIAPLAIIGGVTGLPLAGVASALVTAITGEDPRRHFHKFMKDSDFLERLALYGITTNPTISSRITPNVPFVDNVKLGNDLGETISETLSASNIPAVATLGQITKGLADISQGDYLRGIGSGAPFRPIRNIATATRYQTQGIRTRGGNIVVPRTKVTSSDVFFQGLGMTPGKLTEYYEQKANEKRTDIVNRLRQKLKRVL